VFSLSCVPIQTLFLTLFSNIVLQDLFLPTSRLSIETLQNQYFLPSPLSRYETLDVPLHNHTCINLGVHYLQFSNTVPSTLLPPRFDALYVHHGFGASSLSWLPALPSLVRRMGAKVGLGHDAVGFGFTDRPDDDMRWYTTEASARIGTTLLQEQPQTSVAILGHSLGGLTALKMALQLPKETSKFILLTAPALGIRKKPSSSPKKKKRDPSWLRRIALNPVGLLLQKAVVYPVGGFVLRRLVGYVIPNCTYIFQTVARSNLTHNIMWPFFLL
jgi:pimeloyl-ACP methyl ester carboxylesterase